MIIPSLLSMAGSDKEPLTAALTSCKAKLGRVLLCLHDGAGQASSAGEHELADRLMELYPKTQAEMQRLNRQPIRPLDAAAEMASLVLEVNNLSDAIDRIVANTTQPAQLEAPVTKILQDVQHLVDRLVRP